MVSFQAGRNAAGDSMSKTRWLRLAAALALVVVGTGCAASWAYRKGHQAADLGDWDLAVARFTRALEKDRDNIKYKIALETARVQASLKHYDEAKKALAANDLEKAAEELQIASNYDPANRSAADDLAIVKKKIEARKEEQSQREHLDEMKARAQARMPVPVLSPRSSVPITTNFRDTSLQKIFEGLGKIVGVNVLLDEGFRDKRTDFVVTGISFEQALDRLTFVNRLFYKVLDQNTVIIVPESRQKRTAYDELALRTFYLSNAEVNDVVNSVKALAKVQTVAGNQSVGAITVLGTVDQIAMAQRIIEANDKARGEVVVEVQILEVNRTKAKQWGIDLSNYTASATFSPTGASGEVSNGLTSVRAYLLSSLNLADWVVSVPSTIFARFIASESSTRILAAPKLRAAEGKKSELKIGTEVPIPVTSYTVGVGSSTVGGGYYPATSFQYRNVGVNLTMTPRVAASGDITLEMTAEFSLLGPDRNVGSEGNPINVPTFLTRNVNGVLRLRDGETGLIGGLIQSGETASFAGALGAGDIPILGNLFGNRRKQRDEMEVVMSITPRIVRAPKVTEEDLMPLRVGTQEVPHVEGARPGLFGEPEPAGPAPAPAEPTPEARGRTAPARPTTAPLSAPPAAAAPSPPPPGPAPGLAAMAPSEAAPAPPASAEARAVTVLFSPPEASVRIGQTTSLAVVLVGARDVQWVEVVLAWDPALAEVADVAAGSLLTLDGSPVTSQKQIESGRARVRFLRPAATSGSGAVAAITVRGEKAGAGPFSIESVLVGGAGGTERPAAPAAARLVVTP
jgi:general secretion pathway protein D